MDTMVAYNFHPSAATGAPQYTSSQIDGQTFRRHIVTISDHIACSSMIGQKKISYIGTKGADV